jgi:hypothetical protein
LFLIQSGVNREHGKGLKQTRIFQRTKVNRMEASTCDQIAHNRFRSSIISAIKAVGTLRSELRIAKIHGADSIEGLHNSRARGPRCNLLGRGSC